MITDQSCLTTLADVNDNLYLLDDWDSGFELGVEQVIDCCTYLYTL